MINLTTIKHAVSYKSYVRQFAKLMLVVAVANSPARAQSSLPDLSLEELMNLDSGQVFGASQRLQSATEAPAAVSFVTAEEIRRFGYRTLADILRGVRGMYITDDRNFSLVGAQGFAKPGDYNSRILLLVNGHRVNDNVFGQAEVGMEFGLDAAMFERVEIIRGPASSLYGDSAFFAVINVITKSGASLAGSSITVEAGTLGTQLVRGSHGGRLQNGFDFALSGTLERRAGYSRLYFPAFDSPVTNNGVAEDLDGEGAHQIYGRLSYRGLTGTMAYGNRKRDVSTASFGSIFNEHEPAEQTTDRHLLLDSEYERSIHGNRVSFRLSFDRFTYDGTYPLESPDSPNAKLVVQNGVVGSRWTVGTGITRSFLTRHTARVGVEFIDNVHQDQSVRYVDFVALDRRRSSLQHAAYIEDEVKFGPFIANAGLRYDSYKEFTSVTPRTALIFMPSSAQSFKYLYGRAFRAPNAYELNDFYFGESVRNLRPELIDTHQFVWERYSNDWLRTTASAYWYSAEKLITQVPSETAFLGTSFVNQGKVGAKGIDFEAQMRLRWGWQALASYALQRAADRDTDTNLPNSPTHIAKARVSVPVPRSASIVSPELQCLSQRRTLSNTFVASRCIMNTTVIQPIGPSWELYGTIHNVTGKRYEDPASESHRQDAIPQDGRTLRIGIRLRVVGK